jgi:DNA repair exonuclease SbcCD nuclease subunit
MNRRSFIKDISCATAILLGGGIQTLSAAEVFERRKRVKLRFVVASDGHYGQPKTEYEAMFKTATDHINAFHKQNPLDFCVINGDIIHDKQPFMAEAKQKLDALTMPYYVTRGNHDMVTAEHWQEVWKMPLNHDVVVKKNAVLLGDTSNIEGKYLSPDLEWMKAKLDVHKARKNVFIFIHIPQAKWTANGIDTPAFFELVKKYPNIRAVFHGHEHDQDGVKMVDKTPFLFDSHFGGNWGTKYNGFRVVEVMRDNSMVTYMMNPTEKMNELTY